MDGPTHLYLTKPWQPEELEEAVRDAAADYERLVARIDEANRGPARLSLLEQELDRTKARLDRLNDEKPRSALPDRAPSEAGRPQDGFAGLGRPGTRSVGRWIWNRLPTPTSLSTSIRPPCSAMIP